MIMADSIVGGLFGMNPEMYQQQQNQQALAQAAQLAQLDPMARARTGIMYGANRLVGALGGQDPQLQKISAIQALGQQFDVTTPEGLMQAAGAIRNQYPDVAFGLSQKAQELGLARAKTQKETLSIQQEEKLRTKLANLGPNATQADILRTVTEFGSPDKILAVLESSNRAREGNETRLQIAEGQQKTQLQIAQQAAEARIEAARTQGATALQIAQIRQDSALTIANLQNEFKLQNLDFKKQLFANQPLKPALQKEQDNDFKLIDNLKAQVDSLEPVIQTLQINPQTGKAPIELGPINNKRYELANATGNSTPESRAYANLERAIQNATNLKTDAAKGVQTDKDVLRFANELIAAYGKNDTKTTLESLNNFVNSAKKAQVTTLDGIERRRFSQGISAYGGGASAPKNDNSDPLGIRK
jgi:hypothetical protein